MRTSDKWHTRASQPPMLPFPPPPPSPASQNIKTMRFLLHFLVRCCCFVRVPRPPFDWATRARPLSLVRWCARKAVVVGTGRCPHSRVHSSSPAQAAAHARQLLERWGEGGEQAGWPEARRRRQASRIKARIARSDFVALRCLCFSRASAPDPTPTTPAAYLTELPLSPGTADSHVWSRGAGVPNPPHFVAGTRPPLGRDPGRALEKTLCGNWRLSSIGYHSQLGLVRSRT